MVCWLIEIRFYGRGGQGLGTAAIILAEAALSEGRWSQMIPHFGAERRGAPVSYYVRIDDKPIRLMSEAMRPDCIVVADSILPKVIDVEAKLKEWGTALFNDARSPEEITTKVNLSKIATVDATSVAIEIFGRRSIPATSTALLGAFSVTTGCVKLDSILASIKKRFPGEIGAKNAEATKMGYERTKIKKL